MKNYTLDIAVCTYGPDGIRRLSESSLPHIHGVHYIVSWQERGDTELPPILAARTDLTVIDAPGCGLSLNRNHALEHCTAEFVLIADDDVNYTADAIERAVKTIASDPQIAISTFIVRRQNCPIYPLYPTILGRKLPKGYWVASFEMMLRRELCSGLRFDTRLGIGSGNMECGEELLVLLQARRRGLLCKFFPIEIGEHPRITTGSRCNPGIMRAHGCLIALEFGRFKCIPRLWLKAWRMSRSTGTSFIKNVINAHRGALSSFHFSVKK